MGELLTLQLARTRKFHVIGIARHPREAFRIAEQLKPQLVLADASSVGEDPQSLVRGFWKAAGKIPIVQFNAAVEHVRIRLALRAGVLGYLSQDASTAELFRALETVLIGRTFLSASVANLVEAAFVQGELHGYMIKMSILSPREKEIMEAISKGQRTKEVAQDFSLSPRTVEKHLESIRAKTGQRQRGSVSMI